MEIERAFPRWIRASLVSLSTLIILEWLWLTFIAGEFYAEALDPFMKEPVVWALVLFYIHYIICITGFAVLPATSLKHAARRGAGVGWIAYATFELTNMVVIDGWNPTFVLVDILWGVALTSAAAMAGFWAAGGRKKRF